jgi:hypothetical protein
VSFAPILGAALFSTQVGEPVLQVIQFPEIAGAAQQATSMPCPSRPRTVFARTTGDESETEMPAPLLDQILGANT